MSQVRTSKALIVTASSATAPKSGRSYQPDRDSVRILGTLKIPGPGSRGLMDIPGWVAPALKAASSPPSERLRPIFLRNFECQCHPIHELRHSPVPWRWLSTDEQ